MPLPFIKLSGIAEKYNTTYQYLAQINNIADPNKINAGAVIKVPGTSTVKEEYISYTIKRGDTLSGIAAKYKTTYQYLAKINNIADPNKINAGAVIKVPNK